MGHRIRAGALAGVAGGLVFGMMMGVMGMLPVIAGMVGSSSAIVGFGIHLMISALIGAGFGVVLGATASTRTRSVGAGVAYGMAWWVLGPLTLMPLMMGMGLGSQWTLAGATNAMPSLMGHMIFGAITGVVFHVLQGAGSAVRAAHAH